jgi:nanoRNase/pAp phosphatase (c-di-AMP/oligoRNAs hydrolase)
MVPDSALVGDVADALQRDLPSGDLVVVVAAEGPTSRLSVRTPQMREIDLGRLLADLALDYGGTGGGHRHRGGATIRSAAVPGFLEQLTEALV